MLKKWPFSRGLSLKNGRFLVEVTGLEPAASWSQTRRATNCATPRCWKNLWNCSSHRTGQNCGQTAFEGVGQTANARFSSVFLTFPRFFKMKPAERALAPKCRALPAALHPDGHKSESCEAQSLQGRLYYNTNICRRQHLIKQRFYSNYRNGLGKARESLAATR